MPAARSYSASQMYLGDPMAWAQFAPNAAFTSSILREGVIQLEAITDTEADLRREASMPYFETGLAM